MNKLKAVILTAAIALPVTLAFAGPHRPNLIKAQEALNSAFDHITNSQKANEWDEGHHAEKAKEYIEKAKEEVRLAAEYDNHKH